MLYLLKCRIHRQFNYKEKENQPVTASNRQNHVADSLCLNSKHLHGERMSHESCYTMDHQGLEPRVSPL